MKIHFCNSNDKQYQAKLNNLLKPIFLDFQFWYDLDLWDSNYESYSIMQNNEIVSNICVFEASILFKSRQYQVLSVGAVATKDEYRGNGYSRLIMEHIINKYNHTPMYLFANETVIDFYPRFGFKRVYEKLPIANYTINNNIPPNKLDFDDTKVWEYICKRVNFSQKLDCLNTGSINLFHVHLGYLKDHIYSIPELDTIVIATQSKDTLKIISVFSLGNIFFKDLIKYLPFKNISNIQFGFMPYWDDLEFNMVEYETDPLFVKNIDCDLGNFKVPELSIT